MNIDNLCTGRNVAIFLFLMSLMSRLILQSFIGILSYDEVAYSHVAFDLVENGGWWNLGQVKDAFFFPPLFVYLAAFVHFLGAPQILAVRIVSIVFSSAIAPVTFLSLCNSSHDKSSALIAVALWSIIPYSLLMSVLGQVEMTMIFFVLLGFYVLTHPKMKSFPATMLSGVCLALALWVKETALAFVPVFIYLIWTRKQSIVVWSVSWILAVCPLFISLFTNSEYTLLSEINPSRVALVAPASDGFISAFGRLVGTGSRQLVGYRLTLTLFLLGILTMSLLSLNRLRIRQSDALQFALGIVIVFLPFLLVYSRKNPYYLLPFFLSASFFMGEYLKDKKRLGILVLLLLSALSVLQFSNWANQNKVYELHAKMLREAVQQDKFVRISTGSPRLAQYIVRQENLPLVIEELALTTSPKLSKERAFVSQQTILQSDYYLGNEFFLKMVFCGTWSRANRKCIEPHYLTTRPFLQPVVKVGPTKLYKVLDRSELKEIVADKKKNAAAYLGLRKKDSYLLPGYL